jgi:hypothetical protein
MCRVVGVRMLNLVKLVRYWQPYVSQSHSFCQIRNTNSTQLNSTQLNSTQLNSTQLNLLQDLYSQVDMNSLAQPDKCVFHPSNDMLLPHEKLYRAKRGTKSKCEICSTVFATQFQMDNHLASRHFDLLHPVSHRLTTQLIKQCSACTQDLSRKLIDCVVYVM